ncbi:MAG: ABC transporter transmembrane domain-containing protein [Ascidiaceihabitans sp.]|uniref:ABC transporter transmembrane domain-containing protein n=1 Tax=Ascidiaceihabitans sp. TaxID=1872644 RepID=UPI00329699CC
MAHASGKRFAPLVTILLSFRRVTRGDGGPDACFGARYELDDPIDRTIFAFIWKHSKRDQLVLLAVTLTLFPLLYLTLELPKRIINDAIGSGENRIEAYGFTFTQIEYLWLLCGAFLLAVFAHGIMKMRINTMKGVLAERLLRRFRYSLIARILRFPQPYFERTSQGELVSMVTAESEPMGGLMGDAVAQPALQAGQMLTILGFLFLQSFAFGLAACALIPLQAWLIPRLQKQINLLNKKRVIQVRALAAEIGEGATGAATLRLNHGWRYRMAMITDRLGRLFEIRFIIFQKKFFMKFINNFITQLTPFLFFSIGGYLVIQGDVTLGALVAALAAYKDLSSPWKELLAYYNQSQDMQLRWETITERFAPTGMIDEALFDGEPDTMVSLNGDITLHSVTVRDEDGNPVLEDISATFPKGSTIAIAAPSEEDRRALSAVLTREAMISAGKITMNGHDLAQLHQSTLAARIGHATSRPVMFMGSYGENIMMSVKNRPLGAAETSAFAAESARAGNSLDMLDCDWVDPAVASVGSTKDLREWWYELVQGLGTAGALARRAMDQSYDATAHPNLSQALIDLRPKVRDAIIAAGLDRYVSAFDPDAYNPSLPIGENLLFATPRIVLTPDILAEKLEFLRSLNEMNLGEDLLMLSRDLIELLRQIFGPGGSDHPLFRKLGITVDVYDAAVDLVRRTAPGDKLTDQEMALLLSVPSSISAEQIGPAFPEEIKARVLSIRQSHGETLRQQMEDLYAPIAPDAHVMGLSVLENVLYGKLSDAAGPRGEDLRGVVAEVLDAEGVSPLVLQLVFDLPITLGGANLSAMFSEPLAVTRATIKRPDIVILEKVLTSFGPETHIKLRENLRDLLPGALLIFIDDTFDDASNFDVHIEVQNGRLVGSEITSEDGKDSDVGADLARKVAALKSAPMFADLAAKQLRLLAFGARWYTAQDGEYVFHKNDAPDDGAYMIIDGEAELLLPEDGAQDKLIATVGTGALVGELGLIRQEPRALDMRAKGELHCLRIGVEEFLAVVENDAATAFKLLQIVAGYVST